MTTSDPIDLAIRFAALSGPFDPAEALRASSVDVDAPEATDVVAELAAVCDTTVGPDHRWLMRPAARRAELTRLAEADTLGDDVAWRARLDTDPITRTLGEVLLRSPISDVDLQDAYESIRRDRTPTDPDAALKVSAILEWAGGIVPPGLPLQARSALDRKDVARRSAGLLGAGFEGRARERARLADWLGAPSRTAPVRTVFVTGLPAIGKSTLLEQVLGDVMTVHPGTLPVRLDFDRSGLDVRDPVRLSIETLRQIALLLPDRARDADAAIRTSLAQPPPETERSDPTLPRPIVALLQDLASTGDRRIVFVLDTLEALTARGRTHPGQLFDWLDELTRITRMPLAVVSAGRGDALSSIGSRIVEPPIALDALDAGDRFALMSRLQIPKDLYQPVDRASDGNPLLIKMAAQIVRQNPDGLKALEGFQALEGGHLYRFLESRLANPDLQRICRSGLLVRRLTSACFAEVLAPAAGLGDRSAAELMALYDELCRQTWLLERDPRQPDGFRQPEPVRRALFPLLQATPGARKLHRAAARWFMRRDGQEDRADGLYHRLQSSPQAADRPLDPALARLFDRAMLSELDDPARKAVLVARGAQSGTDYESDAAPRGPAGALEARDLMVALDGGDLVEADDLYRRAFVDRFVAPDGPAGDAARTYLWRSGSWREARRLLTARDELRPDDRDLADMDPNAAFTRLEMRAEFMPELLVSRMRGDERFRSAVWELSRRDVRGRLAGGALDMLLRSFDIDLSGRKERDAVRWTMGTWVEGRADMVARELGVPSRPARTLGDQFPLGDPVEAAIGRSVAQFNPFVDLLRARLRSRREVFDGPEIARLAASLPPPETVFRAGRSAATPFDDVVNAGWFAEWLSVFAKDRKDADLTLIAARSEAWRQTIGGRWRFGPRSPGWRLPPAGIDAMTRARLLAMMNTPDPVGTAHEDMERWQAWASLPAEGLLQAVAARASRRSYARGEHRLFEIARQLHGRRVPSALVPPVSVLVLMS